MSCLLNEVVIQCHGMESRCADLAPDGLYSRTRSYRDYGTAL